MKQFKFLFATLLISIMSISLSACGDDEPENQEGSNSENKLSEKAQKFVGSWSCRVGSNTQRFTFFPNGKAMRTASVSSSRGIWSFDEETDILATTLDLWQFQITMSTDEAWTGFALNTGKTINASKSSDYTYIQEYLRATNWRNDDNYQPLEHNSSWDIVYSDPILKNNEITMNFRLELNDHYRGAGSITITDTFKETPKMTIDSNIEDESYPCMKGEYTGSFSF